MAQNWKQRRLSRLRPTLLLRPFTRAAPWSFIPDDFEPWLDHRSEDMRDIVPLLRPQGPDYFEMEPTVIQRNAPPPKPKQNPPPDTDGDRGGGQMNMF